MCRCIRAGRDKGSAACNVSTTVGGSANSRRKTSKVPRSPPPLLSSSRYHRPSVRPSVCNVFRAFAEKGQRCPSSRARSRSRLAGRNTRVKPQTRRWIAIMLWDTFRPQLTQFRRRRSADAKEIRDARETANADRAARGIASPAFFVLSRYVRICSEFSSFRREGRGDVILRRVFRPSRVFRGHLGGAHFAVRRDTSRNIVFSADRRSIYVGW